MIGDWRRRGAADARLSLVTAVGVALFTHRTARDDDELPHFASDRRGVWFDHEAGEVRGGWPMGSRLWLLSREKQTEETRMRADEYIREAIDPFIEHAVIETYELEVSWFAHERLGAMITLYRGNDVIAVRFERLWDEVLN